jgi:hypothetical protein
VRVKWSVNVGRIEVAVVVRRSVRCSRLRRMHAVHYGAAAAAGLLVSWERLICYNVYRTHRSCADAAACAVCAKMNIMHDVVVSCPNLKPWSQFIC